MRRNLKAIHKTTGVELFEAHQCGDCGEIYDRVPTTRGEDSLNVCGSCQTVEGQWRMVWVNDNNDFVASETDPDVEFPPFEVRDEYVGSVVIDTRIDDGETSCLVQGFMQQADAIALCEKLNNEWVKSLKKTAVAS